MIDKLIGRGDAWVFIAETLDGSPVGFAEVAVRDYANGCESQPVPFLEGIYVKGQFRRQGIGARLIECAEALLVAHGFRELGSDTEIDNRTSHAAHLAWRFSETERAVYFRKLQVPRIKETRHSDQAGKPSMGPASDDPCVSDSGY